MQVDKWKIMLVAISACWGLTLYGFAYYLFGWAGLGYTMFAVWSVRQVERGIKWLGEYKYGSITLRIKPRK